MSGRINLISRVTRDQHLQRRCKKKNTIKLDNEGQLSHEEGGATPKNANAQEGRLGAIGKKKTSVENEVEEAFGSTWSATEQGHRKTGAQLEKKKGIELAVQGEKNGQREERKCKPAAQRRPDRDIKSKEGYGDAYEREHAAI